MGRFRMNILFGELAVHAYDQHESETQNRLTGNRRTYG